jgi:hypothetical protein
LWGAEPGDLLVDQLSYDLWFEDSSIETHCRVSFNESRYRPDSWAFKIHGWVEYESPQKDGRIDDHEGITLDKEEVQDVTLCFHLPVPLEELTSAVYGFWWSTDDDWLPPREIEETISLTEYQGP